MLGDRELLAASEQTQEIFLAHLTKDRARSRSQVYVEYFINLYTSAFIRLPHLYEELYVHSIVIINAGGMG